MELSVVIPTRNRSRILHKVLDAFCCQRGDLPEWELLVIDDGSSDNTAETVQSFAAHLPVRYLFQSQSGVSKARNRGLTEAIGRVVLFLDDDVIPEPHLAVEHTRFHREFPQAEHALLGYVTWDPTLPITPFMRWYGEFGGLFAFSRLRDNAPAAARFLYSCNVSFKCEFLRAAGGFNESLSVLEDHELGYRLHRRGMILFFRRAALGRHHQTFTFDQACQRLARYRFGLPAFLDTEAGRAMAARRARPVFRMAEAGVKFAAPLLFPPLRRFVDSDQGLPNAVYRLFYWYYASYGSFWAHASSQRTAEACQTECN
jgi:glycosyltransferase involved in cell wall biosynthesis